MISISNLISCLKYLFQYGFRFTYVNICMLLKKYYKIDKHDTKLIYIFHNNQYWYDVNSKYPKYVVDKKNNDIKNKKWILLFLHFNQWTKNMQFSL